MKRYYTLFCLIVILLFASVSAAYGQHLEGTVPPSYNSALIFTSADEMQVAPADADFIANAVGTSDKSGMYVIAQLKDVDISPLNAGTWEELESGEMIWRCVITSTGAKALSLHFDRFNLPVGGRLYVYDENHTQLLGGYDEMDNTDDKGYSIGMILGDKLIIEYVAPALLTPGEKKAILNSEYIVPDIHISQVSYIFRGVDDLQHAKDIGDSGSCEVNINCPEGDNWQIHKRSVVRIYVVEGNSGGWCSGTLINNLTNDGTPYILTANHCGPNATAANFNQWRFYFNLEYTGCTGTTQAASNNRTGCTKIAAGSINGGSDFFLLQMNQAPDNSWNPIYAGWRRDNTAATTATGIHHPAGDVKKISSSTTITTGSYSGCASNAHWRITDWRQTQTNQGVTEGGSSGSALFDQNGYVVGTLTGGAATCANPHNDYYGKMSYHWDQNGSNDNQQLKPWLDPNNTGSNTCPYFDPNNPDTPPVDPDDPDDPDNPDDPDEPDEPDNPGVVSDCHRLHYPLAGTLTLYRTPDDGYLAGTNTYGDIAKADYFAKDSTEEYLVNMSMNIGPISGNGNVTFCVWADDNGRPGALLGSKTVSLSTIASESVIHNDPLMPTSISQLQRRYVCRFNSSITVNGSFFAGFTVPATGTFSLVTNSGNQAANTGWEMNSDSTWTPYSDSTSWGISLTHALFPQLCDNPDATDIEEWSDENAVIFPNPTTGMVTVRLENGAIGNSVIRVFDMNGRLLQVEQQPHGDQVVLNLSNLSSGLYIIAIQSDNKNITKKVSLIK